MSTRIAPAFRTKRRDLDLFTLVRDLRVKGEASARAAVRQLYEKMLDGVDEKSIAYAKAFSVYRDDAMTRIAVVHQAIGESYKRQLGSMERNSFDLDVTIAIREHDGRYYLRPHCDMHMREALDFLREDKRLEDYSYWNNTDPPKGISWRSWEARSRTWKAIGAGGSEWRDSLLLQVCSHDVFFYIDPHMDLMDAAKAKRDAVQPGEARS